MSKESIIRDDEGNPTHIRVTSNDGTESVLHEYDGSLIAGITGTHKGKAVEIAVHSSDGTTDSYEYDSSIIAGLSGDHRGQQKNDSGGFCFLTTACVEHAGLSDTCHELTVLRGFRDKYVAHIPGGTELIAEYYATAPRIVRAIARRHDSSSILSGMLVEIGEVVSEIEKGSSASALAQYGAMFERLKAIAI